MAHIVVGKSGKVRTSFSHLLTPDEGEMGGGKYSVQLLIPKDDPCIPPLKAAIETCYKEAIASGTLKKGEQFRNPLKQDESKGDRYKDIYFIDVKSTFKPVVIDRNRTRLTTKEEVYSGMYAAVVVSVYAYKTKGNKGIGLGLEQVLKIGDGDRLDSSAPSIEEAFEGLLDADAFEEADNLDSEDSGLF